MSLYKIAENPNDEGFYKQASNLARLGSGSAARSIYGGYTIWGKVRGSEKYDDLYAEQLQSVIHPVFRAYKDAILIVSSESKKVGSSAGHALMNNNPYARVRYKQAMNHTLEMIQVLEKGDTKRFIEIVEMEALTLHGLMMTSNPGYLLMQKETIDIIDRLRWFRKNKKIPVAFTLDAGPNVHILYPEAYKKEMTQYINDSLLQFCVANQWIDDGIGPGPKMLTC
jgi:diphosphomevalonate decarboxylase